MAETFWMVTLGSGNSFIGGKGQLSTNTRYSIASTLLQWVGQAFCCQIQKACEIFLWCRNVGKLTYLDLGRVSSQPNSIHSLCRVWQQARYGVVLPSGYCHLSPGLWTYGHCWELPFLSIIELFFLFIKHFKCYFLQSFEDHLLVYMILNKQLGFSELFSA
jgi:hypothetical protein